MSNASLRGIGPDRRNCKRCPTYQSTQGHGSTACVPCQQRGLAAKLSPTDWSDPPLIPSGGIAQALIDEISDSSYQIDVMAAIRILPTRLAGIMSCYCIAKLTEREIARMLKVSQPAIHKSIRQAAVIIMENLDKIAKSPSALIRLKKRAGIH